MTRESHLFIKRRLEWQLHRHSVAHTGINGYADLSKASDNLKGKSLPVPQIYSLSQ